MNLILHWTSHHYAELAMNLLRCIVVMELFQNAWSLSVVNSGNSKASTRSGSSHIGMPWRKKDHEKEEAHVWLEDDFTDEKSSDDTPDLGYDFEVSRYLDEETVDSMGGFDPLVLETLDDENLAP